MNETIAIIFMDQMAPHESVIAYEQAEIDDYREDCTWLEIGSCIYDSYKKEIIKML